MVKVKMNGYPLEVRVDAGCGKVLILEEVYQNFSNTTRLIKTKVKLSRPYGTKNNLEVKGWAKVTPEAMSGQYYDTYIFVVNGHKVEPLVGLDASKALGILSITPEGTLVGATDADKGQSAIPASV